MQTLLRVAIFLAFVSSPLVAQITVFWQPGFPTVASQPLDRGTLSAAFQDLDDLRFLDLSALQSPAALANTRLLILPYGSAVPTDGWPAIEDYLQHGGNLLVLGGQPLRVPVTQVGATFVSGRPQDIYSRALDLRHTYEVPVPPDAHFAWKPGYSFGATPKVHAEKFFTVEGHLNGLGYMVDPAGLLVAASVIVRDLASGSRIVCLDFQPAAGYWQSQDGLALIRQAAGYARQGAASLSIETLYSVLRPNEAPQITVHLRQSSSAKGEVRVELSHEDKLLEASTLPVDDSPTADQPVRFRTPVAAGFYQLRATYRRQGHFAEFYETVSGLRSAARSTRAQPWESTGISSRAAPSHSSPSGPITSPPKRMARIFLACAMPPYGKKILPRWPPTVSPSSAPASG